MLDLKILLIASEFIVVWICDQSVTNCKTEATCKFHIH